MGNLARSLLLFLMPDRYDSEMSIPGHSMGSHPNIQSGDPPLASPGLNSLPFPASPEELLKSSPDSQVTAASDLTSSDKLSALPPSSPPMRQTTRRSLETMPSIPDSHSPSPNRFRTRPNSITGNIINNYPRANASDGTFGTETPGESDRLSLPALRGVRNALSRIHRRSDSATRSSGLHATLDRSYRDSVDSLPSQSRSPSRGPSPMRFLQQLSAGFYRGHYREEPFVPINPFKLHFPFPFLSKKHDVPEPALLNQDLTQAPSPSGNTMICLPLPVSLSLPSWSLRSMFTSCSHFLTDILPSQVYLHVLLRLPSLYFSRVARIFEDAEVSRPDIQKMIDACSMGVFMDYVPTHVTGGTGMGIYSNSFANGSTVGSEMQGSGAPLAVLPFPENWNPPAVSPALARFKNSWEMFIDSLLREWKTLNLVSALLLSAILTMLQVPTAVDDPLTRSSALVSLICALMSLSYGCIYIVRFGTMRSMYKASRWAEEARKGNASMLWNVWVLLAMPAVWLAWSMIFFIVSILSFVWRTGSTHDPPDPPGRPPLSPDAALAVRITITALFGLGMVYFAMIVNTLRKYGAELGGREREREMGAGVRLGLNGVSLRDVRELRTRKDAAAERRGRKTERRRRKGRKRDEKDESDGEKERKKEQVSSSAVGLGFTGIGVEREGKVVTVEE